MQYICICVLTGFLCLTSVASATETLVKRETATETEISNDIVILNKKTHVYHAPTCGHVRTCTKNCIETTVDEAVHKGARPCHTYSKQ